MPYTVYVLYSHLHHKIYIGYTSNLLERFKSHNALSKKDFTSRYRPWMVIYCEYFDSKQAATNREKQLKSGKGREGIHAKIDTEFQRYGFISA